MFGASQGLFARLGVSDQEPDVERGSVVLAYVKSEDWGRIRFFFGGVKGVQIVLERASLSGQIAVNEAMRVLMGGAPLEELVATDGVQLVLGPGDDGGMF
jgi:cobalamin biosynthesis protein CbiD